MSDTSSSSSSKTGRRCCPSCRARMSTLKHDSHVLCIQCRGVNCNLEERCDICRSWSEEVMNKYLKHQRSLECKRLAKRKAKASEGPSSELSEVDFAVECTRVTGSIPPSSENASRGDGDDSASTVTENQENERFHDLFNNRFRMMKESLYRSLHNDLDQSLGSFAESFTNMFEGKFTELARNLGEAINNHSVSAPREVPFCLTQEEDRQDNPVRTPQDGNGLEGELQGTVLSGPSTSPSPGKSYLQVQGLLILNGVQG